MLGIDNKRDYLSTSVKVQTEMTLDIMDPAVPKIERTRIIPIGAKCKARYKAKSWT